MENRKNIKCEISYDGTDFHGFQVQPNQRTIQGELINSIYKLTKEEVTIIASGRTDAGVHARKQVCNFYTDSNIPAARWKNALNAVLPDGIIILNSTEVPSTFHSRYDVKEKTYRYHISNKENLDLFRRKYAWHYPHELKIDEMRKASKKFLGEHNFTSFSSAKTEIDNKVRFIYQSEIWEENNEIIYQVTGNGFLYNMVRIIVGTLVDVGSNRKKIEDIEGILSSEDRNNAGKTAPAKGLFLWDIKY